MNQTQLIVLFGDSLLMDTVEAGLDDLPHIGVMRIHAGVSNVNDRLKSLTPNLVIFDWDADHCHFVLPFLRDQPGTPLLGLDITASRAIAVCSREHAVYSINELSRIIQQQTESGLKLNQLAEQPA